MKFVEWIRVPGLAALICLAPGGSHAGGALPEGVAEILERAANRPEARYMEVAVALAADAYPELAGEITELGRALAPRRGYAVSVAPAAAEAAPTARASPPPVSAPAQVSVVPRGFFGELGLHGEVEGGLALNTGNTDEQTMNAKASVVFDRRRWRHKINLEGDWTVTRKSTTKQRFLGSYEANYAFSRRAYVFGFLSFEDDRFSGFDHQVSQSMGAGYKFLDTTRLQFSLEAGPNARQSKVKPRGNTELEYGGRLAGEFKWRLSRSTSFTSETAAFIGSKRSSLDSSSGIRIKISDRLSGKLSYDVHWDGNVPDGHKSTDTVTRGSVVYDF